MHMCTCRLYLPSLKLLLSPELHRFAEDKESHTFFQLYTNQSTEKVDLGKRWNDKRIEPDGTVTLLYRYVCVYTCWVVCQTSYAYSLY